MGYSINFKSINTFIAVTIALTTISCLVLPSAQAINLAQDSIQKQKLDLKKIKFKFSGSPNGGETFVDFILDPSVQDASISNSNIGIFERAIQDVKVTCTKVNSFGCTELGEFVFSNPSTLRASKKTNYDGVEYVEYKATLDDNSKGNFLNLAIDFFPSNDELSDSINSLEALSQYLLDSDYPGRNVFIGFNGDIDFGGPGLSSVTTIEVPEPNLTGSLLGTGAIGALLLLKRVRRSRKSSDLQSSAIKTQEIV